MSTKTIPTIPPRPARGSQPRSTPSPELPKVPPRPLHRGVERSVSPHRDSFAPSPLNELPNPSGAGHASNHQVSPLHPPARPPSVTLPSIGQEGSEYEGLEQQSHDDTGSGHGNIQPPLQTRNVSHDLHLHAPRPSLPSSTARAQVQPVTRTDSNQAAAAGIGKSVFPTRDEAEQQQPSAPAVQSAWNNSRNVSSNASADRRRSAYMGDDAETGQRVPMYPEWGEVQAPSPAPHDLAHTDSQGVDVNDPQRTGRRHVRTRSGREVFLPPGSYGLRGHGVPHTDKFEKAWYDKHPEELVREEQGVYRPGLGSPRPEWALSSEDLNKIVRISAQTGTGLATSANFTGTPEEEVGYIATDEIASRLASPPASTELHRAESWRSQPPGDSALEKSKHLVKSDDKGAPATDVTGGEPGHDDVKIHIDEPLHHQHHPDGFAPAPTDHAADAEPVTAEDAIDEAPILASDEVEPGVEHLQPAVSPSFERRSSSSYFTAEHDHGKDTKTPSVHGSRLSSRPSSTQASAGPQLARLNSRQDEFVNVHTPLEDVEEYEPLFPEDDEKTALERSVSAVERFKQQQDHKHRFPSEDLWEDVPDSLRLEATVSTPDVEVKGNKSAKRATPSEKTDTSEKKQDEVDTKQRFPSKDIWEDAPESHQLVTTVSTPEIEEKPVSPESEKGLSFPSIPARRPKRATQSPPSGESKSPEQSAETTKPPPAIPGRPKPQIPARPAKPIKRDSEEELTRTISRGSEKGEPSAPAEKVKPAVPSRPAGSKIAALKAGFLSDLNNQLKLGPQGPKPKPKPAAEKEEGVEPHHEPTPLSDARKGRARGPTRRKPAAPVQKEEAGLAAEKVASIFELKMVDPWTVWRVDTAGNLIVGDEQKSEKTTESAVQDTEKKQQEAETEAGPETETEPEPEPEPEATARAELGVGVEPAVL